MTITRVTAYGEKLKLWCTKNRYTSLKCTIPLGKQDRVVINHTRHARRLSSFLYFASKRNSTKSEQQDRTPPV